ncbi:MAG: hypothetical protein J2P47_07105 [Acetobacteraceae bacterium]|nr:hypothetical protein [Acetobacteraceae bacterium]
MRLRPLRLLLLIGFISGATLPARAQMDSREAIALQNEILQLRHDLETLQSQTGRDGGPPGQSYLGGYGSRQGYAQPAPPSDLTAQLLDRVQTLEEQVRRLRGQLDEVTNETQRQTAEMAKQIGDLNFQLQRGAPQQGPPPAGTPPATMSPPPGALGSPSRPGAGAPERQAANAPPVAPPRRTPELALQEAHASLARRDYSAAEAAAREVLQGSRTSPRAYDAQFLLAQALAGKRNHAQAAIAFDDAYNRSRTGSHAADALLGLATALTALGEKRAACDTIAKLDAEFPNQRSDIRESAAGVRKRADCH